MNWLIAVVVILVIITATVFLIGSILPREHVAERTRQIPLTPSQTYAKIADLPGRAKWVPGLKQVTIEPGGRFYTEVHDMGPLRMEILEQTPPAKFVTRIADEALEFGGAWTITIARHPQGATVTIREDGFVKSPLFRFFSRFVFGHTRTMDRFLQGLATP